MKRRVLLLLGAALVAAAAGGAREAWRLAQIDETRVLGLAIDAVDGRSQAARARLTVAAQLGNVAAMRIYGIVLLHGDAAERERGRRWLERAAARGDVPSLRQLGEIYLGREPGAERTDEVLACNYYRRAAEAGDRDAAWRLGRLLHRRGEENEALRWTQTAADAGQSDAMFTLANAYADGTEGLPRDTAKALLWYQRSAERNQPEALQALGLAYLRGELGLARDEQRGRELIAVAGEMSEHRVGGIFSR